MEAIDAAVRRAKQQGARPSLIMVHTVLGHGAPHKQNTFEAHGSPLGVDEVKAAKENMGWPTDKAFYVPPEALAHFRNAVRLGKQSEAAWEAAIARYAKAYPEQAATLRRRLGGELPKGWDAKLAEIGNPDGIPTRKASETVMQALAASLPELMGGSADLNPSTFTWLKGQGDFQPEGFQPADRQGAVGGTWCCAGRNVHFGVREHAMGSIAGGMALHGGVIPYTATFLAFADYMRPPMRLAALGHQRVVYVFTHDSVALGEDGPTHQPIEQVMNLRAVPNMSVIRPADAAETAEAWRAAIARRDGPTTLVLSRQKVAALDRTRYPSAEMLQRGGYVLWQAKPGQPQLILIATGSEMQIALQAAEALAAKGVNARVVAMPSWDLFDAQSAEYRESVLPAAVRARVSVEAGTTFGWEHYVGLDGASVGMTTFGASAPEKVLAEKFGLTAQHVVEVSEETLSRCSG